SQLYRNHYNPEDHQHIANLVVQLKTPWIVTYDNCQEIKDLYKGSNQYEFSFHYSTHMERPKAKEIMFHGNMEINKAPTMRR
ncbi:MAG: DNA adenine methylase, partial [Pseudomonas sp.]|nr:DNA adenine methylase [Pseudomonas sp.]